MKAFLEVQAKADWFVRTKERDKKMVGQNEGQGAFGNDLTNVMAADSQEELARRSVSFSFISFFKRTVLVDSIPNHTRVSVINICRIHFHTPEKQPQSEADSNLSAIHRFLS